MNKNQVLDWLVRDAEKLGSRYRRPRKRLEKHLYELNSRRQIALPQPLPKEPEQMISTLREHFKNRVTLISLVLSHHFPDRYLFYRVSRLEPELFAGFEFLADVIPGFQFPFSAVGRNGFDRYLRLNESLMAFAREHWPRAKKPQEVVLAFLYAGLAPLFLEKSDYNRYWIAASRPKYFEALDSKLDREWSGRKEMQAGDLVFVYRTSPRKAITDLYRVTDAPRFDPWGAWKGFWVDLEHVCEIEDIFFGQMRHDPILGQWGVIRKQFTGTVMDPVPHSIYNRLLEQIPEKTRLRHHLQPEPMATTGSFREFVSEAEFEAEIVEPLLRRWAFKYQAQYPCLFRFGTKEHRGRVDFFVSDEQGPLTLFEDKFRILNERDLELAVGQAKSYALMLGLGSFVVASPEGLWVYALDRNQEILETELAADELAERDAEVRSLLLRLRARL